MTRVFQPLIEPRLAGLVVGYSRPRAQHFTTAVDRLATLLTAES